MMTFHQWRFSYTPDDVYLRLVKAGLGDMSQELITQPMYERAMRGEVVIKRPQIGSGRGRKVFPQTRREPAVYAPKCQQCGGVKERRGYAHCKACRAEMLEQIAANALY